MAFPIRNKEHSLLGSNAFDFIVLDDEFLLENLNSIKTPGLLGFSQHDFTEVTLTKDSKEIEMVQPNTCPCSGVGCRRQRLS